MDDTSDSVGILSPRSHMRKQKQRRLATAGLAKMSETNSSHPNSFRDNPMAIAEYLSPAFAKNELRTILDAINLVMRAQNVLALAEAMGVRREPLYRSFGGNIDPHFGRVLARSEEHTSELQSPM